MSLFFQLGRGLGQLAIPTIRKSRWVWRSLTGTEEESIRAEAEFGQALATELRLKTGVSHDPGDLELVRTIGKRLSTCVRNKLREFRVEVLREPGPTALALPGGFIFLSVGLLDFSQRQPDELAFVIGHEMGHIVRGHAMERLLGKIGTEGIAAILSRGLLNPLVRETGMKWLESAHSREAECDADEFALRVAAAAGYDPDAAFSLLQRLATLRASSTQLESYFSSHPPEEERIAYLQSLGRINRAARRQNENGNSPSG